MTIGDDWLFTPAREPQTAGGAIIWWEKRRIPYNGIVLGIGFVSFVVFMIAILTSGHLEPGEDVVEPLALFFAPIAINIMYTLGWLIEAPLRLVFRRLPRRFGPVLFALVLGFSIFVVLLPSLFWVGFRVLQLLRVIT